MNQQQAQTAVSVSAVLVAGMYAYRKLTESKPSSSTGHFVIGYGFTFLTLSVLAQAAPALGGMFAVLVATGDVLVNGQALFKDLNGALAATAN
jgi:hypothetical protein